MTSIHRNEERLEQEIREATRQVCEVLANAEPDSPLPKSVSVIIEMVEKTIEGEQDNLVKRDPQAARKIKTMINNFVKTQLRSSDDA